MADALPNLLVVGVPKAGTSSLFFYLAQHPSICASDEKEIGYFTPLRNPTGKLAPAESYARHFAHCRGERYRLEATPSYSYGGERVVAGIKDLLGSPRIIISLRDPVERLWSGYTMQRTKGQLGISSSFDEYITVCEERHRMGTATTVGGHYQGLSIGFYASYLGWWLDAFPENVKIIFTEDLFWIPVPSCPISAAGLGLLPIWSPDSTMRRATPPGTLAALHSAVSCGLQRSMRTACFTGHPRCCLLYTSDAADDLL